MYETINIYQQTFDLSFQLRFVLASFNFHNLIPIISGRFMSQKYTFNLYVIQKLHFEIYHP